MQEFEAQIFSAGWVADELCLPVSVVAPLLRELIEQTAEKLSHLRTLTELTHSAEIIALSHDIKGSCANFRLNRLSLAAGRLESSARNGTATPDNIRATCDGMEALLQEYRALFLNEWS